MSVENREQHVKVVLPCSKKHEFYAILGFRYYQIKLSLKNTITHHFDGKIPAKVLQVFLIRNCHFLAGSGGGGGVGLSDPHDQIVKLGIVSQIDNNVVFESYKNV